MNSKYIILTLALLLGGIIGAYIHKGFFTQTQQANQLKLEEILSIKELHLVKHSYKDLFFLHRKNDMNKSIRAIAQVPVTITSYINLKEIELIKENDSIKRVILPKAKLNPPSYQIDKMIIRKTRSFQLHAGSDLYPEVSQYLKETITERMDTIRATAIENKILQQAEAEGKEYIETLLKALGRQDIIVSFGDAKKDKEIQTLQQAFRRDTKRILKTHVDTTHYVMDHMSFGWIRID